MKKVAGKLEAAVIIPCRNEVDTIARNLDSMLKQLPSDSIELIVVDGMSDDGTRDILARYEERYPGTVRVIENAKGTIPAGMNLGIRATTAPVILKVDAHSKYPTNYIRTCVETLRKWNVDNVGGCIVARPQRDTLLGRGICGVISHPFGVGNSSFRLRRIVKPTFTDAAFSGCYWRERIESVGMYDERIRRSEDLDLNNRIRAEGGRTLLLPDLVVEYFARSDYVSFFRHNFDNGVWITYPRFISRQFRVSPRHLAPLAFVLALSLAATGTALASRQGLVALTFLLTAYSIGASISGIQMAIQARERRLALVAPILFLTLHISYGLGSMWGLIRGLHLIAFGPSRDGQTT